MVRTPFYDKNGVKKGAWSREEDDKLRAYVHTYGHSNWRQLPKFAGLARCGKSCRLRWLNYLRPNLKHGNYTPEEEEIIIRLHQQFGNRWSLIAEKLPGRTDNEVKNYWHSHLKKSLKRSEMTASELKLKGGDDKSFEGNLKENCEKLEGNSGDDIFPHILESSLAISAETAEGDNYSLITSAEEDGVLPLLSYKQFSGDFWSEPFLLEDTIHTFKDDICTAKGMALLIPNFDAAYFL